MSNTVEVYVADHKHIDFAIPDYCKKVQVNAELTGQWEGYLHDNDNTSDNISSKNAQYAELTALYAMWKNCTADIQGLFHYRRFISDIESVQKRNNSFVFTIPAQISKHLISEQSIQAALEYNDVILTSPVNPYPFNALEDLKRYCLWSDIHEMIVVIHDNYPEYISSLADVFNSQHISYCNMFIARREFVDKYCTWLFDVLAKVEERISLDLPKEKRQRLYAYLSEVLLNVYIRKHNLKCKYFCMLKVKEGSIYSVLFRFPAVLDTVLALAGRKRAGNIDSLERFLAGLPDNPKIAANVQAMGNYMRSRGFTKIAEGRTEHFAYVSGSIRFSKYSAVLITFVATCTINEQNLRETITEIKEHTGKDDESILPRIVLKNGTPDSVKYAFIESGISIMEYD